MALFGTSGVRGPVGETVTAGLALDVGRAVATDADRVVVGRDARDSGRALVDALAAGLVECGTDVVEVGVAATPTVARAVAAEDADAGVVVTASHNPPADNGIKLWTPSGQAFDTERQTAIESRIHEEAFAFAAWDDHGVRRAGADADARHRTALVDAGERAVGSTGSTFADLSVVVDLGNGTGRVTADALHELGADVETLNAQRDGRFPGRPSEPTAETCRGLCAHVAATDADLGIAHDGDADRMMAVTGDGEFVPGDLLLALFARREAGAGDAVAAPVDTSLAVDDALAEVGATVTHTRVGDVYVAERAREDGVAFGGEPSGAWIFPEQTLCPDGPLAAVTLAAMAAAEPLADRLATVDRHPIRRASVEVGDKDAVMARITDRLTADYADTSTLDGVRVELDDGWFLVRASGTQPLVRLTAEARDPELADGILAEARTVLDEAIGAIERSD